MNKTLLSCLGGAAVALAISPVFAADLRMATKAPAMEALAPVTNWNGFYIGVQGGYQWGRQRETEFRTSTGVFTNLDERWNSDGFVGGGHVGYNFAAGSILYGIEGDFEGADVRGTYQLGNGAGTTFDVNWQSSIRGRLGFFWGPTLLYVTGGAAFADLRNRHLGFGGISLSGDTFSSTETGYTVGAGAEWMFSPAWSARVEYRYTDFGRYGTDVGPASFPAFSYPERAEFHTVRGGISYHFGGLGAPGAY